MSLIARARHHLFNGSFKHIWSPIVASRSLEAIGAVRHFTQTAMSGDGDEVVEIDQRMLPADYDPATFDPTNHRGPPTKRVWGLVDEVCGLTLAEANELSTIMMEKFCFIMMKKLTMKERFEILARSQCASAEAGAAKETKKPENATFELKMESYEAASKLKIIKELRSFMELGLKEAKDLVEKSPTVIKKGVLKEEAEKIIEKMKALGAKVVMV
ncbi:hypothetical protein C2S52_013795 [Perilla frutescens var. hirtella]|uniref:Large ribosomal subunit protein bL12 C-terminal domain-containing protein n=1 Tax=Perilla frutescens var. hirtella TaxID=608512 RepID=A0AAD4IQ66_PERFH|nr:hypothetical protein C2S53_000620 [Perilla frutescens var. hirtella]KAH6764816.1 hypothetical protein C2S51_016065 [Perilla frutescens var. frutescens]KAH6776234.1 hypothetical protein C2S52_013795 [Perilla frutescens var. hirtella]